MEPITTIVEEAMTQHQARLEHYMELLQWWNARINLLSRDVSRETIAFHIHHSLNLLPFLEVNRVVVDIGTGGGLPGIALAIADPSKRYVLNDIQQKKCMALRHMIQELGLTNTAVTPGDASSLDFSESIQWISKHAFKMDEIIPKMISRSWSQASILKGMDDIHREIKGVPSDRFTHEVIDLQQWWSDERYQGKGLWIIRRGEEK
jgi:16S rRNA (guanine527-N7)-methyltransferase